MTNSEHRVSLEQLVETAEAEARVETRRARNTGLVFIFLGIFVVGYMSWIRYAIAKVEPADLARIAASHVEEKLPEYRVLLTHKAIEVAPDLMDKVEAALLDAPRAARVELEARLQLRMQEDLFRLEQEVDAQLEAIIETKTQEMATLHPGLSPEDRLDRVMEETIEEYRARVRSMTVQVADAAALEMRRLNAHFQHLQNAKGLTERQKLEKEILETWSVLVLRHGIATVDVR